jgi:hypothetical protein
MTPAGYSGKPLIEKLGYAPGDSVLLIDAPETFAEYLTSQGLVLDDTLPVKWLHFFCLSRANLEDFISATDLSLIETALWVSWPKLSSNLLTDVTEQSFRDAILPTGWVDTKVCAIDDTWSGLKFVRRKNTVDARPS